METIVCDPKASRTRRWLSYALLAVLCGLGGWQARVLQVRQAEDYDKRVRSGFWERVVLDSNTAILAVEADTHLIVDWNKGSERMLGWTAHDVVGSKYSFLLPEDLRDTHLELLKDTSVRRELSNHVATINCWVYTKNGSPKSVLVRVRGAKVGGRYYYIVTFDEQRNIIRLPDDHTPPPPDNEVRPKPMIKPEDAKQLLPPPAKD
jgi:PAS domain S-box-containing protein